MAVEVTRVLVEGTTNPGSQVVTITDQSTGLTLGTGSSNVAGVFSIPVQFELFLAGVAAGAAAAQGGLGIDSPTGDVAGAAGGVGGAAATLSQSQALGGTAGGTGGAGPSATTEVGSQVGTAGGQAGASATMRVVEPEVGAAGGQGGAGATMKVSQPISGSAGGVGGAGGTATAFVELHGSAAGTAVAGQRTAAPVLAAVGGPVAVGSSVSVVGTVTAVIGLEMAVGLGGSAGGQAGAGPSPLPDVTIPAVSTFTVGTPSGSNVPVTAFTATDNVGVTGYLITESSTPPAAASVTHNDYTAAGYTAVGTGSVTLYPWVRDSAGNVSAVFGSPRTVTIESGVTAVSDNFNRADSSSLGANWTTITGCIDPAISSNHAAKSAAAPTGAYWSANAFADNQYAEVSGISNCSVRCSDSQRSCYFVAPDQVDEGDGYITATYQLAKVVNGTITSLGSPWYFDSGGAAEPFGGVFRIEANGTTIRLLTAPTHGGTYTQRASVTDSSLTSGWAGIYGSTNISCDDWYGGDLT